MIFNGHLNKMRSVLENPIQYYLQLGEDEIYVNDLLNKQVTIRYLHEIHCIKCGRKTSKSFAQGYCYPCFRSAPETEDCVLRPELCRAHEGIARDMDYAREHCLIDHFTYLSYTSEIKVGVTRNTQIPTRWIDQGAISAILLAQTPNRYTAGLIEVALKSYYSDKTNWRSMLKEISQTIDLVGEKYNAINRLPEKLKHFITPNDTLTLLHYPIVGTLQQIVSIDLDKVDLISDTLIGIKGQYFLFQNGKVINIRKHSGYRVEIIF
jgi:hypothetical protein